ncbi:MAG: hypothetical protein Q7S74_02195 [Nanoarchaeota archaeon]|nr:hypothetical protein [Nanoarchaeota archaeon]
MVEKRVGRKYDFDLNESKLTEMVLTAYNAAINRQGIFTGDYLRFLPQWNLPTELEYNPRKIETKDPEQTAKYLWTCAFFERLNQSKIIMENATKVWYSPKKNWIFDSSKVCQAKEALVEQIIRRDFQFNLQGRREAPPVERFCNNAKLIVEKYDCDPRNLIKDNTVEQARKNLIEFEGIGSGIANLFIIYMIERNIALPKDPHNALLKVDIHKGRLPINCNAIIPHNGEIHRDSSYTDKLEKAYREICQSHKLDSITLDDTLWIIGSEICAKMDYTQCKMNCPLFNICEANTPEDRNTGRYIITKNGKRIDSRKHKEQLTLPFIDNSVD